jgi:Domain of unknown function (DUF4386)
VLYVVNLPDGRESLEGGGRMDPDRRTAAVAGVLFIVATVASLVDAALLNPVVDAHDYLAKVSGNETRVITGAFFSVIAAFASAGIAIALYRIVRRHSEGLALGSVGFRLVEGTFYIVGTIAILLLLTVSRGTVDASALASGRVLLALRDWAGLLGVMAFYVGGSMYYLVFYRSRLIPRWLSGWGLVGVALGMVAALIVMFRTPITHMPPIQVVLNIPIGVQELVLAVWLLVKGFEAEGTTTRSTP